MNDISSTPPTKAPSVFNLGMVKGAIFGLVVWLMISLPFMYLINVLIGDSAHVWKSILSWNPVLDESNCAYMRDPSGNVIGGNCSYSPFVLIFTLKNFLLASMPWLIIGGLIGGVRRKKKLLDKVMP